MSFNPESFGPTWGQFHSQNNARSHAVSIANNAIDRLNEYRKDIDDLQAAKDFLMIDRQRMFDKFRKNYGMAYGQAAIKQEALDALQKLDPNHRLMRQEYRTELSKKAAQESMDRIKDEPV